MEAWEEGTTFAQHWDLKSVQMVLEYNRKTRASAMKQVEVLDDMIAELEEELELRGEADV